MDLGQVSWTVDLNGFLGWVSWVGDLDGWVS